MLRQRTAIEEQRSNALNVGRRMEPIKVTNFISECITKSIVRFA